MKIDKLLGTLAIIVTVWGCAFLSVWGLTLLGLDVGSAVGAVGIVIGVVAFIFIGFLFID